MLPLMVQSPDFPTRVLRFVLRLAIQLPVFLAVYVLSIGPMFWYWYESRHVGGSKFLFVLYYPLTKWCTNETVRHFINRYIDWWIL